MYNLKIHKYLLSTYYGQEYHSKMYEHSFRFIFSLYQQNAFLKKQTHAF